MSMLISDRQGAVAVLTLNNPAQYNALAWGMLSELDAVLDAALADRDVRAILLTGAGKGFCSGAQFGGETFAMGDKIADTMRSHLTPVIEKMRTSPKPVVTAINGPSAGAGVGIALAGDVVIAARSAKFILSFVRLGATLDGGTSLFLQRAIGVARARVLALTGEPLSAEQAADWGLIWKCVDDSALMEEAMAMAQRLAAGPPLSMAAIKTQFDAAWDAGLSETLEREAADQAAAFRTLDLREGATAFVEKRAPKFSGR